MLTEARDALLAAGDAGTAAEAEVMLGKLAFREGDGEAVACSTTAARIELLDGAPAVPVEGRGARPRSRAACPSPRESRAALGSDARRCGWPRSSASTR